MKTTYYSQAQYGDSSVSIMSSDEVAMHGQFNFSEVKAVYLKMKELAEDSK